MIAAKLKNDKRKRREVAKMKDVNTNNEEQKSDEQIEKERIEAEENKKVEDEINEAQERACLFVERLPLERPLHEWDVKFDWGITKTPSAASSRFSIMKSRRNKKWPEYCADIDVDDEENNQQSFPALPMWTLPKYFMSLYDTNIEKITKPQNIPQVKWADQFTISKIEIIRERFCEEEKWALIEGVYRFHRYGRRAFKNLRAFAVISRNTRLSEKKALLKRLKVCFDAIHLWTNRYNVPAESLPFSLANSSVGESLANQLRNSRLLKFQRRGQIMAALKHVGADTEDYDERGNLVSKKRVVLETEEEKDDDAEEAAGDVSLMISASSHYAHTTLTLRVIHIYY